MGGEWLLRRICAIKCEWSKGSNAVRVLFSRGVWFERQAVPGRHFLCPVERANSQPPSPRLMNMTLSKRLEICQQQIRWERGNEGKEAKSDRCTNKLQHFQEEIEEEQQR